MRKVKILKSPKFDITKLMEVHGDYSAEVAYVAPEAIERPKEEEEEAEAE